VTAFAIRLSPARMDQIADLEKKNPSCAKLITDAVFDLADNPRPTNSAALGTSQFRRLLLGLYRVTYRVNEQDREVEILSIGRSPHPR
jgi:mRNA-degrading endonuclease RelE of RelBE toxin-antitoxin system